MAPDRLELVQHLLDRLDISRAVAIIHKEKKNTNRQVKIILNCVFYGLRTMNLQLGYNGQGQL